MRVAPLSLLAVLSAAAPAFAVPAFPGAEGFGANAKGARASASPAVYHVTNLNDSGAGSLRDAVGTANRIVVFDVGGIIRINTPVVFSSGLTIAGQTAPGGGITVYGNRVSFSGASNTICRYMRFRMGIDGDDGADAVGIASGSDLIFDHVSASWGRDETFSVSGDAAVRITLQDCLVAQGLRIHSAGGLMQTSGGVSIFRTLYADNWMRNPKVKGVNDYINNVVYNWGGGGGYIPAGDSAGDSYCNVINCYFIGGIESGVGASPFKSGNTNYRLHHSGNLQDLDLDGILDGTAVTDASFPTLQLVGTRFAYPAPTTQLSAPAALAWVLDHAGASQRRDRTDDYVVAEVRSYGTSGVFIYDEAEMGGIGAVAAGLKIPDADNDGMPDWWEQAAGTNPSVADATVLGADGYLNIERYLNALVTGGVPGATIDGISTDTGSSASDGITADTTLVLRGAAPAGASVAISRADTGLLGTVTADASGQWTYDYTGATLANRSYAFQATATVASVLTPPSPAFVVRVDTVAAPAPVITSAALAPGLVVSGTATPGDTVTLILAGIATADTAVADELGNWTVTYTGSDTKPGGIYALSARAMDLAGNPGPLSATYSVDTNIASPAFTGISSDTGASATDRLTNDTTLTFSGTAPAGSTVSVTRAGTGVIGTASAPAGTFSLTYAIALPAGSHLFTATASQGGYASPASPAFAVTIDTATPVISSIKRLNPATYSTNGGTVVFRVTFAEPVTGVDVADFNLTKSGTASTGISLAAVSQAVYDVTVTGVSGDGTLRLNLNASGTGIVDLAGNAASGAYTSGQTYTVRLAGSGVWTTTDDGELWSESTNWDGGLIASGSGATADFSLRDIADNTSVILDSNRTLGRLVFGDADPSTPAGWTISDGGVSGRTIAFSGSPAVQADAATTPDGDTVDVPAASAYPHHLAVTFSGSGTFTKTGVGTLELNRPNPSFIGGLTISKGILQVGPGGTFTPKSVTIATSQQLRVAGGTFSTPGDVVWTSGTGTGVIVSGGTASFQNIVPSNTRNSFFKVTGGTVTARDINFPRSGDSESQTVGTGLLIFGGATTFANIGLGTSDSWGGMTVSGGTLTVTGVLHNGYQKTAGRGGVIYLSGGTLNVSDTASGLVMSRNPGGSNANTNNVSKLLITGGVANLGRLTLGYDSTASAGSATVTLSNGELNLGAGGIVKNGGSGLATAVTLTSGTLGALASWSTSHPLTLAGTGPAFVIRAATTAGLARDITLTGSLTGTGGFTKTGDGTLTLAGSHSVGDSVYINAGTLYLSGSLTTSASGKTIVVNSGGVFAGTGTTNIIPGIFAGGTLSPGGASSATWTLPNIRLLGGARLAFNLGSGGDQIVTPGVSFGGGTGGSTLTFVFTPGTIATGTPYTLISGPVSLTGATLAYTGLGYARGHFTVNSGSLQFTLDDDGVAVTPFFDWLVARGLPAATAEATDDPDHDGVPALLEFVFGSDPAAPGGAGPATATTTVDGSLYPTLSYVRRQTLGGVVVTAEVSPSVDFASPTQALEVSATPRGDGFETVLVRSTVPMSAAPSQFLRIRATLP